MMSRRETMKVVWSSISVLLADIGIVNSLPIMAGFDHNEDNDDSSTILSPFHLLYRHKRSANNTATATDDGKSAIERFYDDPNNKAMFLVFPIFVLIICTCCGLYFCDKLKRHLKKKKAENRKNESSMINNDDRTQNTTASSIEDKDDITAPINPLKSESKESPKHSMVDMSEINRDDTPLEDVEDCPEISAVNAVPIKHRETSFMTDVRSANSSIADDTVSYKSNTSKINVNPTSQTSTENQKVDEKKSRPSSKQRISSANKKVSPINNNIINTPKKEISSQESEENIPVPSSKSIADKRFSNTTPDVIKPSTKIGGAHEETKRPESMKSASTAYPSNTSGSETTRSNGTISTHEKTSPPDVVRKFPKTSKKFTSLSPEAIGEILQYYKDKKHMPDIIPDDSENLVPIKKKSKRGKYKVFNG